MEAEVGVLGELRRLQEEPLETSFSGHHSGFNRVAGVDAGLVSEPYWDNVHVSFRRVRVSAD
jgi:hypothetical protein